MPSWNGFAFDRLVARGFDGEGRTLGYARLELTSLFGHDGFMRETREDVITINGESIVHLVYLA